MYTFYNCPPFQSNEKSNEKQKAKPPCLFLLKNFQILDKKQKLRKKFIV